MVGILVDPGKRSEVYLRKIKENNIHLTDIIYTKNRPLYDNNLYEELRQSKEDIFIFTGGGIVPNKLIELKNFIHIHPGLVPEYKGSTCFYYSIIKDNNIGMSAIYLDEDIDSGDVIAQKVYNLPSNKDIDNTVDPELRSDLLVEVLKKGDLSAKPQKESGNMYYVIHPVLKHIAILKVERNEK